MKIYSLRTKVIVLSIISFILISSIGSYVINERIGSIVMERLEKETKIIMENTRSSMLHLFEHDDSHIVEEIVGTFTDHELVDEFQMCSVDLKTLYSSDLSDIGLVNNNMCILAVAEGKTDLAAHFSIEDETYEVAMPIKNDHVTGILYAHLDTEYIENILYSSRIQILKIFNGGIFTVMFIVILMVNYFVLKPIEKIKRSTKLVIADDYNTRIQIESKDEFEELAILYNEMIDSIQDKTARLEEGRLSAEAAAEERLNFLAHMSHEIRSPLNSIIGFTSLLLEKKNFEDDIDELKIIMKSCKHLLQVINEVIDISKYEHETLSFESAPFNIRQLVYEVDGMFDIMSSRKVEYGSEVAYNVPDYFIGDAYRIKEVLINLISNALKFTEQGYVTVRLTYDNRELKILVEDTGVGIPLDKQQVVFDAFSQSDESTTRIYGGSGLGLAISKRLALNMGGDVELFSDGIRGTKFLFTVDLPIATNNDEEAQNGYDYGLIVERWLASDSTIRDLVLDYLPDMITQIKELKDICLEEDWNLLKDKLHRIKGTSAHFGILQVYHLCRDFEAYLYDNTPPYNYTNGYVERLMGVVSAIPESFYVKQAVHQQSSETIDKTDEKELSVLVVDDVVENRLLIQKILEKQHVAIVMAENGEEAITKLKEQYFDCVLLDIQMPVLSGESVLKWIANSQERVAGYIITLTANSRLHEKEKYLSLGSHDYMVKPINKEVLREKLNDLRRKIE